MLEKAVNSGANKDKIKPLWENFWTYAHQQIIGREISGKVATSASVQAMETATGMDLCCEKYAAKLNNILRQRKSNVCRLLCDDNDLPVNIPDYDSGLIGPGRVIAPVFLEPPTRALHGRP
jgi:hypothetical protein